MWPVGMKTTSSRSKQTAAHSFDGIYSAIEVHAQETSDREKHE